jgi:hypothetical protein
MKLDQLYRLYTFTTTVLAYVTCVSSSALHAQRRVSDVQCCTGRHTSVAVPV